MTTYLEEVADAIRQELSEDLRPEEDDRLLFLIYAVLALAKGKEVTAIDVHNAWSAWMVARNEGHESVVPFDDLTPDVKREDTPFVVAIRRVAERLDDQRHSLN